MSVSRPRSSGTEERERGQERIRWGAGRGREEGSDFNLPCTNHTGVFFETLAKAYTESFLYGFIQAFHMIDAHEVFLRCFLRIKFMVCVMRGFRSHNPMLLTVVQ